MTLNNHQLSLEPPSSSTNRQIFNHKIHEMIKFEMFTIEIVVK